jgi:alpha,alpha-trehalase
MLFKAQDCFVVLALVLARNGLAQSSGTTSPSATATSPSSASGSVSAAEPSDSVSHISVSTVVASPSAAPDDPLPSQVALPPKQSWCPSEIFCAGELLQTVNIANLYVDQKTFVDKPTVKNGSTVLADFGNATSSNSTTAGHIATFVNEDFGGEGLELEALQLADFNTEPQFLSNVSDPIVKAFSQTVHGFWTSLIRKTNESALCDGVQCESSLIPLNHTFVVPGGRFREQYYWDSFWIVEGLIQSELYDIVNATLQNFMDELEHIGFIPNGGRIYFLNRSQPPLFTHMLASYVAASNDTAILKRALPLAEKEMKWWQDNRTVKVKSPFTNQTHSMARYAVTNSAPRPESYLTDYNTANDPELPPLSEDERAELYSQLATGAESGWDYTARWFSNLTNVAGNAGLRTLNVKNTVPVCLNSILYKAHMNLASFYTTGSSKNNSMATSHKKTASSLKAGILDLFWDSEKLAFYDFSLNTTARTGFFSPAAFYPFWNDIIPDEVLNSSENAFKAFSSVNLVMNRYNGTFPSSFMETGLQWDAPNAWPPHQYAVLKALANLPLNISNATLPASQNSSSFSLIPENQLGLTEDQLPHQPLSVSSDGSQVNASTTGLEADVNSMNGTVYNGGNVMEGEGWGARLQRELANRYLVSAFCSWHATGGEIPGIVPKLSSDELNVTQSQNNTGNMFEKFSNLDIDSAGRGGEYTVQAGFGWTNGVVLWVASNYGKVLAAPQCPSLLTSAEVVGGSSGSPSGTGTSDNTGASATPTGGASSNTLRMGSVLGLSALVGAVALL